MKRQYQNKQEERPYQGQMDVRTYEALQQMKLQQKAIGNQKLEIMLGKAGEAGKAIAGALYEVGVKAPARAAYGLASLGVQAGVGLAGVVASTAVNLIPAVMAGYAAFAHMNEEKDPLEERAEGLNEYIRNMTKFFEGSHGPTINI